MTEPNPTRADWRSVPWCCADHSNHPPEPHNCRCRCWLMTDRRCPEHGDALARAARLAAETETP